MYRSWLNKSILPLKRKDELLAIDILTILLLVIIALIPSDMLRPIIGLPVGLFFPGYTLLAMLFPEKDDFSNIERLALSFGLSILIVSLIGLILNYTPSGIRLYPVVVSTSVFIITTSLIASSKRYSLPPENRFKVSFGSSLTIWRGKSTLQKSLYIGLVLAIAAMLGTMAKAITTQEVGERFTQFYILDSEGKAENYPAEISVGEEVTVILGIVNQEREDMSYRLEVTTNEEIYDAIGPVALAHEEKWENKISITMTRAGEGQKVEFLLYKLGENEPYLRLYLSIDVKEPS